MDLHTLFQAFLNSETAKHIYVSIVHLVDNPIELHHALYWSNSIRTTSGEYIHFIRGTDVGKAIFPLDFIYFQYFNDDDDNDDDDNNNDYTYRLPKDNSRLLYISRIKAVGKNYSTEYDYIDYISKITLIVQEYITIDNINNKFPGFNIIT